MTLTLPNSVYETLIHLLESPSQPEVFVRKAAQALLAELPESITSRIAWICPYVWAKDPLSGVEFEGYHPLCVPLALAGGNEEQVAELYRKRFPLEPAGGIDDADHASARVMERILRLREGFVVGARLENPSEWIQDDDPSLGELLFKLWPRGEFVRLRHPHLRGAGPEIIAELGIDVMCEGWSLVADPLEAPLRMFLLELAGVFLLYALRVQLGKIRESETALETADALRMRMGEAQDLADAYQRVRNDPGSNLILRYQRPLRFFPTNTDEKAGRQYYRDWIFYHLWETPHFNPPGEENFLMQAACILLSYAAHDIPSLFPCYRQHDKPWSGPLPKEILRTEELRRALKPLYSLDVAFERLIEDWIPSGTVRGANEDCCRLFKVLKAVFQKSFKEDGTPADLTVGLLFCWLANQEVRLPGFPPETELTDIEWMRMPVGTVKGIKPGVLAGLQNLLHHARIEAANGLRLCVLPLTPQQSFGATVRVSTAVQLLGTAKTFCDKVEDYRGDCESIGAKPPSGSFPGAVWDLYQSNARIERLVDDVVTITL